MAMNDPEQGLSLLTEMWWKFASDGFSSQVTSRNEVRLSDLLQCPDLDLPESTRQISSHHFRLRPPNRAAKKTRLNLSKRLWCSEVRDARLLG